MFVPVLPRPTINKSESKYSQKNVYVDGDKVRFREQLPEKIGGWSAHDSKTFVGICRNLFPWLDNAENKRIGVGTHIKLYAHSPAALTNITPVDDSGTLGADPFSVTSGSAIVTVTDTAHARIEGAYVTFSGATAFGGITPDGEYTVTAVNSSSEYTITHSSNATSTASGGGSSVTYSYEINPGFEDQIYASGYGVGTFGTGTYGTPRSTPVTRHARTWSLDAWGQNLVACPRNGNIYEWDPDVAGAAVIVSNAPTDNTGMFVSAEKHMFAVGADGDKRAIKWSDQDDNTDWTATTTNLAGDKSLESGSEIIGWTRARSRVYLFFTDSSVHEMVYTGDDFVYAFGQLGAGNGLVGPNAVIECYGITYWMSHGDFFMYDGFVKPMQADDIRDYVFGDINEQQLDKVVTGTNAEFGEIWWLYPSSSASEVDRYVAYSTRDGGWVTGTLVRTAWADRSIFSNPLAAGTDGVIYDHETGTDDAGSAMESYIEAAPMEMSAGNQLVDILGFVPDFDDLVGELSVEILTRDTPNGTLTTSDAFTVDGDSERIDTRESGRQAGYKITSDEVGGHWRMGLMRFDVQPSGNRR